DGQYAPVDDKLVPLDFLHVVDCCNKRTMDTHETVSRQQHLTFGNRHPAQYLVIAKYKVDIVAGRFEVVDGIEVYLHLVVSGFDEDIRRLGILAAKFQPLLRLIAGFEETRQRERFEQVVHGIQLKAGHGMLGVGGRKNHQRLLAQASEKFDARDIRHLDIKKQKVYRILPQVVHRLKSIGKC